MDEDEAIHHLHMVASQQTIDKLAAEAAVDPVYQKLKLQIMSG